MIMKSHFIVDCEFGSILFEEDTQGCKSVIGKYPTHDEAYEALEEIERGD